MSYQNGLVDDAMIKQIEYENMLKIQHDANNLLNWSLRYLGKMREGEIRGNKFMEHVIEVRDALATATSHSIECNHEFAKTRKRTRNEETFVHPPPPQHSKFAKAPRVLYSTCIDIRALLLR